MSDAACPFCSIVSGELPARIVDRDEHAVAFMDVNPWARGHALVVPRTHSPNLYEIDPADFAHVLLLAQRVAERMELRLGCDGVSLWNSCGRVAGQHVDHFHLHVIPHYEGDPPVRLAPRERADERDLMAVAQELVG